MSLKVLKGGGYKLWDCRVASLPAENTGIIACVLLQKGDFGEIVV